MLNRKIYNELEDFFKTEKKALLISGARQVGKTFAIRTVGSKCFKNIVEINFLSTPQYKDAFFVPTNAKEILYNPQNEAFRLFRTNRIIS